jgi:hypothetical protein
MGLIDVLTGNEKKEKSKKEKSLLETLLNNDERDRELEEEMDAFDLDEEERKLVKDGTYNPWDFEYQDNGDGIDDDDYYGEDN